MEIKQYMKWPDVPDNFKSRTWHKQNKLNPGPLRAIVYQKLSKNYIDLFDVNEAIPKKEATEKQIEAVKKARGKQLEYRTCKECGNIQNNRSDLVDGICRDCIQYKKMMEKIEEGKNTKRFIIENKKDYVILDRETTGLDSDAEIIEIAIIDLDGNVLLDTLIKPVMPIPDRVIEIHGINNDMVQNAPTWDHIHNKFIEIIENKVVLAFNSDFDIRMLEQTSRRYDLQIEINHKCLMKIEMNCLGINRYISLKNAVGAEYQSHRAVDDCMLCIKLLNNI